MNPQSEPQGSPANPAQAVRKPSPAIWTFKDPKKLPVYDFMAFFTKKKKTAKLGGIPLKELLRIKKNNTSINTSRQAETGERLVSVSPRSLMRNMEFRDQNPGVKVSLRDTKPRVSSQNASESRDQSSLMASGMLPPLAQEYFVKSSKGKSQSKQPYLFEESRSRLSRNPFIGNRVQKEIQNINFGLQKDQILTTELDPIKGFSDNSKIGSNSASQSIIRASDSILPANSRNISVYNSHPRILLDKHSNSSKQITEGAVRLSRRKIERFNSGPNVSLLQDQSKTILNQLEIDLARQAQQGPEQLGPNEDLDACLKLSQSISESLTVLDRFTEDDYEHFKRILADIFSEILGDEKSNILLKKILQDCKRKSESSSVKYDPLVLMKLLNINHGSFVVKVPTSQ